ncbi:MAG: HAD family hydrolase [Armatimonadetes bacterium]|nr:HAD family hydrolase [Armatimonadota bacterium]
MAHMRPAVFLDRDGTIIEDRGHLNSPDQVRFIPGACEALRELQSRYLLFIVTNQGGIGQGIVSWDDVNRVNAHVAGELRRWGVQIAETYVCPHSRDQGCRCIKPEPFFLHRAAEDHSVDLAHSFTVGDHPHDVELASRAGACAGIFVLTGHGEKHRGELPPEATVVADIGAAARMIVMWNDRRSG